jgi:hypothetical protein
VSVGVALDDSFNCLEIKSAFKVTINGCFSNIDAALLE